MNETTARAVLALLVAQTEYLGIIAKYYSALRDADRVRAIPGRTLTELRDVSPEAAEMAERVRGADVQRDA
jgi:hypothetical protein